MQTRCPTKLVPDTPTSSDAFGSHERLAEAIESLVVSEKGGKAIALIGSWGSGKSTVVEILKGRLRKNSDTRNGYRVFVFDAWAHNGDPLRRAFLEGLLNYLISQGWIEAKKWEDEVERLARRLEDAEIRSEPILEPFGKWMALSLLLLPIGFSLLQKREWDLGFFSPPAWLVGGIGIIGMLLLLLPVLLWAGFALKSYWGDEKGGSGKKELVGLLINKVREKTKTKTVRTPDPTSLEFQGVFQRALSEAMSHPWKRLLVVIDNLDRVCSSDARLIWATMRTFFEIDGATSERWLDRFWLLVPIANESLQPMWTNEQGDGRASEPFVDKTFQIKFRVPPPLLSDWKDFLERQLMEAFPAHQPIDEPSVPI